MALDLKNYDPAIMQGATVSAPTALALTNTHIIVGDGNGAGADVALSGDATLANTGAMTIANGAINNAKVNASAAIAFSKLASLTDGNILVGNGSNVATSVAVSGNATLANTGALSVTGLTIANQAAGDILYFNGSAWVRLAKGTSGQTLKMNAGAMAPEWVTV